MQTDLGTVSLVFWFEVAPGTTELRKEPDWKDMLERIERELKAPQRSVVVDGFVDPATALTPAAREKLARSRAELVRRRLVARGVAPKRVVARVGDVEAMRVRGYQGSFDLVEVGFEPAEPVREDFEPSSAEYRLWCGTLAH